MPYVCSTHEFITVFSFDDASPICISFLFTYVKLPKIQRQWRLGSSFHGKLGRWEALQPEVDGVVCLCPFNLSVLQISSLGKGFVGCPICLTACVSISLCPSLPPIESFFLHYKVRVVKHTWICIQWPKPWKHFSYSNHIDLHISMFSFRVLWAQHLKIWGFCCIPWHRD